MTPDTLWAHFAVTAPRLKPQVTVQAQSWRGERWYVLANAATMQTLRVDAQAWRFLAGLDGERSCEEALTYAERQLGPDAPTPEDCAQVLLTLAQSKLLDGLPGPVAAMVQSAAPLRRWWQHQAANPVSVRVPFGNPSRLLARATPLARALYSPAGLWTAGLLLVACALHALTASEEIGAALSALSLNPRHAFAFAVVYVAIKLVHEFAHGLALRAWGEDVREAGLMFMWFFPSPYVDASASALVPDKYKRAAVAAAGVGAELSLAALGYVVWQLTEPGLVNALALNVMVVGTVSTLALNGNPLMKFDAYYVLEDLIEIPNFATRANRYWLYLFQRYLLGHAQAVSPVTAEGERRWFLCYAPAAACYRLLVLGGAALWCAGHYLAIGVAIALLTVTTQILVPLWRALQYVATSPALAARRPRALAGAASAAALVAGVLFAVPLPSVTATEGVVWTPVQGTVHAGTEGFVRELLVPPDTPVVRGRPLLRLENLELRAQRERLVAQREALRIETLRARGEARARAAELADAARALDHELAVTEKRIAGLLVTAESDGVFAPVDDGRLLGRHVAQGAAVGHLLHGQERVVRAVVTQRDIGKIRDGVRAARVRLAERPATEYRAREVRETPAGATTLPARALGVAGGGPIALDAQDPQGLTAAEPVFTFELPLPAGAAASGVGGRAYVRFDHPPEALGVQLARTLRQLFLSRLGV